MRPQQTREKNPYHKPPEKPSLGEDWAHREGEELGYQRMYGEYGSNARGWVDRPHEKTWPHREHHAGIPPKKYQRSDESIMDHIADVLTYSPDVDATEVTIAVKDGNVILSGTVPERGMIYLVDELLDEVHGIKDFDNHLKVAKKS